MADNLAQVITLTLVFTPDHLFAHTHDNIVRAALTLECIARNLGYRHLHLVVADLAFTAGVLVERQQHILGIVSVFCPAVHAEQVTTMGYLHTKTFLDLLEVSIVFTTKISQTLVVLGVE